MCFCVRVRVHDVYMLAHTYVCLRLPFLFFFLCFVCVGVGLCASACVRDVYRLAYTYVCLHLCFFFVLCTWGCVCFCSTRARIGQCKFYQRQMLANSLQTE